MVCTDGLLSCRSSMKLLCTLISRSELGRSGFFFRLSVGDLLTAKATAQLHVSTPDEWVHLCLCVCVYI